MSKIKPAVGIVLGAVFVITAYLAMFSASAATSLSPTIEYTAEQHRVCRPMPLTDSDVKDAKVNTNGREITAIAMISAPEGRMLDSREGAVAIDSWVRQREPNIHVEITERIDGLFPITAKISSRDSLGGHWKLGRSIDAKVTATWMSVEATYECALILGLLDGLKPSA